MAGTQIDMSSTPPFPIRQPCPPGACNCGREALLDQHDPSFRVLRLTKEEEKKLIARIERVNSLQELRYLQKRITEQLGIQLHINRSENEVRTVRGILIEFTPQIGLCKKTQQTLPAAIRRALDANHEIIYELLDEDSLFSS